MTDAEKIAAFIATRGVQKISAGVSGVDYTNEDWRDVVRGNPTTDQLIAQRRIVAIDAAGRELIVNGLGEAISFG